MLLVLLLSILLQHQAATAERLKKGKKPHILFVLVDDYGWGNIGYHRPDDKGSEIRTPTLDKLAEEGIKLNRHYAAPMCTPTRSALQSGRLPVHVQPSLADPCARDCGVAREMTGIASKLEMGGYRTHQVGKWDAGMASFDHTPMGRGFNTSLNYFGHGNWMWTQAVWEGSYQNQTGIPSPGLTDLWDTDKPATDLNRTDFEEWIFRDRMKEIIEKHPDDEPLFLFYAPRIAHYPLQAPPEYQEEFMHIKEPHRRVYSAMVKVLDDQIKWLSNAFKEAGLWDDTLMVLSSDNGGFVGGVAECDEIEASWMPKVGNGTSCFNLESGANNYPLRGGKYSSFEGGIRVNAFLSGGYIPETVRGTQQENMVTISDWYATFCALAGVDPFDAKAAKAGLPPVDSINLWPLLSGSNTTAPRAEYLVNANALVKDNWKLLKGRQVNSGWAGPRYPNVTSAGNEVGHVQLDCSESCLFDVANDPSEYENVASKHPDIVAQLEARLKELSATIIKKDKTKDPLCDETARTKWGGFLGPWIE